MPQCKVPLFRTKPGINLCVLERAHDGLHYTYGMDDIWFSTAARDKFFPEVDKPVENDYANGHTYDRT